MARYVITPDVALALARDRTPAPVGHQLLAPALLRSQALSSLYGDVRRGEITRKEAGIRLDHIRTLRLRLLGDRVLQSEAWRLADLLGWDDTFTAEYVALTHLHADALVTFDSTLLSSLTGVVATVPASVLGVEP